MSNYYDPNKDNKKDSEKKTPFFQKKQDDESSLEDKETISTENNDDRNNQSKEQPKDPFITEREAEKFNYNIEKDEAVDSTSTKDNKEELTETVKSESREKAEDTNKSYAHFNEENESHYTASTKKKKHRTSPFIAAGFWIRLVAFIIDTILASAVSTIFASPILALMGAPQGMVDPVIRGIFYFGYFVISTKVTNGQTLGKMILGLRVVHPEEEQLSWTTVLIRELFGRFIHSKIIILYIIAAFTPKKQHIVDMLADTYVVKDDLYMIEKENPRFFLKYS